MRIDELLKTMLNSFFIITTGITASIFVFCLIFSPEAVFSISIFGSIFMTALICELPLFIFYSPKELDKKQMLNRTIVHFFVVLVVLILLGQLWDWIDIDKPSEIIVYVLLVSAVYLVVQLITVFKEKRLADRLNKEINKRYHN